MISRIPRIGGKKHWSAKEFRAMMVEVGEVLNQIRLAEAQGKRSVDVKTKHAAMYVRFTRRIFPGDQKRGREKYVDIAHVTIDPVWQRCGFMKQLLYDLGFYSNLFIENVMNEPWAEWLQKDGWVQVPSDPFPSYTKLSFSDATFDKINAGIEPLPEDIF